MGPSVDWQRCDTVRDRVERADCGARTRHRAVASCSFKEVAVVALVDHVAPRAVHGSRIHPGLECHRGRQIQRWRVDDIDDGVRAVEAQRVGVLPSSRPGRILDGAEVSSSRGIQHLRSATLIERVRGHQVGHCRQGRDARSVGIGSEERRGVGRTNDVAVGGIRRQPGRTERGPGHSGQLHKCRAAHAVHCSTRYPVTPTLSVAGAHESSTRVPLAAVAVNSPGADGGSTSGPGVVAADTFE